MDQQQKQGEPTALKRPAGPSAYQHGSGSPEGSLNPNDKTPTKKVTAFTAGGGIGGHLAIILAYFFPSMSAEVIVSASTLIVLVAGGLLAYFIKPEQG